MPWCDPTSWLLMYRISWVLAPLEHFWLKIFIMLYYCPFNLIGVDHYSTFIEFTSFIFIPSFMILACLQFYFFICPHFKLLVFSESLSLKIFFIPVISPNLISLTCNFTVLAILLNILVHLFISFSHNFVLWPYL